MSETRVEVLRGFFEKVVEQCQEAGLVWGKELYFDATQVNANADLDSLTPRFAVEAREAIQTHLATLFAHEDMEHEQQGAAAEQAATAGGEASASPVIASLVPPPLPVTLSEAEHGELAQENAARHDWIVEQGKPQREVHGHDLRTADFRISTTDPDATERWRHALGLSDSLCC